MCWDLRSCDYIYIFCLYVEHVSFFHLPSTEICFKFKLYVVISYITNSSYCIFHRTVHTAQLNNVY